MRVCSAQPVRVCSAQPVRVSGLNSEHAYEELVPRGTFCDGPKKKALHDMAFYTQYESDTCA